MSSSTLYRASGWALLLGAALSIIGNILSNGLFTGNDPHQYLTPLYTGVVLVGLLGGILLLIGLPGIVARQASHAGLPGFVGAILTFFAGFLLISFDVVYLLVVPWLAQVAPKLATYLSAGSGPPAFSVFFLMAGILLALGGILLGIATMRAGILPRFAGLLLIISAVVSLADSIPLNSILSTIVATVGFVLFFLALGWMGYALMSERRVAGAGSAPAPALKSVG